MKRITLYIRLICLLSMVTVTAFAAPEASFKKLYKTYTLNKDGSMVERVYKELDIYTHAAMNGKYGESFIVYNPEFQKLKINESYTLQKDGNKVVTPENAFVEALPSCAANAPAYNHLKEMVVVHTGLELGAKIVLDYTVETEAEMCGELDIFSMIKELSPIEDFRLTISVPESKKLNCELLNLSAKPSVSVANGMKTVSYSIKNIAPRPYSYPVYNSTVGVVQQVASGMMPAFTASTYENVKAAADVLNKQFKVGDSKVIEDKIAEFKKECGGDKDKLRKAISKFMTYLYGAKGLSGVSLPEAGYRLRPASEVLLSMYGTRAEIANLDNVLHKASGLDANIKMCFVKASDMNCVGLSGIVSVVSDSEMNSANKCYAYVQQFMAVTDLKGDKSSLRNDKSESQTKEVKTIEVNDKNSKSLAGGYVVVSIPSQSVGSALYSYSENTSISENIILPCKVSCVKQYNVKVPDGKTWIKKQNVKVSNEVGEFIVEYKQENGEVKAIYTLNVNEQLITVKNYKQFYSLMSECKAPNNCAILFK